MGAREKLNGFYGYLFALMAGLLGLATGSWGVFGVALAILVVLGIHSGSIRLKRKGK